MINLLLLAFLGAQGTPEVVLFKTSEAACVALAKTPGGKLYLGAAMISTDKKKYVFTDSDRVTCSKQVNVTYSVSRVAPAPAKTKKRSKKKKK